jgi:hypothetical protein
MMLPIDASVKDIFFALARDESARNVTISDPLVEYPFIF